MAGELSFNGRTPATPEQIAALAAAIGAADIPAGKLVGEAAAQTRRRKRFDRIFRAIDRATVHNPRNAGLYTPTVTPVDNGATTPAITTRAYTFAGALDGVFKIVGGTPVYVNPAYRFYSAVIGATGGTIGQNNGRNANFWRVSMLCRSTRYLNLRVGPTAGSYRLLVDGRYISLSGIFLTTTTGTTVQNITVDFGSRGNRVVTVEGTGSSSFLGVNVEATGSVSRPESDSDVWMTALGDSYEEGTLVTKGDDTSMVLADLLGVNGHISGSGGTKWGELSAGAYSFETRIANGDLALGGRAPDLIVLRASVNNKNTDAAVIQAGALAGLQAARTQYPDTPILVRGCVAAPAGPLTGALSLTTSETAVAAAVAAFNDPLCAFLPNITDPLGASSTGAGSDLTFTADLSSATSGTLASAWTNGTVAYIIRFSDGSERTANFTQNSTSVTWTGAVTATKDANVYSASNQLGSSLYKFKQDWTHLNAAGAADEAARDAAKITAALRTMAAAL